MPGRFMLSTALLCSPAEGLLRSAARTARVARRRRVPPLPLAAINEDAYNPHSHRWKHEPFDFSSKVGWDSFYRNGLQDIVESAIESIDGGTDEGVESLEYEWHPTIPHAAIVDAIRPAISSASQYYSQQFTSSAPKRIPSILLVGCGNSALPRILHDAFDTPVHVTCLDYSPVCIEMIRSMYEGPCPRMDFVVGDATKLQDVDWDEGKQSPRKKEFDVSVDKGLLDALMCGEGFDLEQLMESINGVLTRWEWGMHVLICFQLSKASKESLVELGSSNDPGLVWNFDIPVEGTENGRARFNLARRRGPLSTDETLFMTTEWI